MILNYFKPLLSLNFWFKTMGEPFMPVFYYAFLAFFSILLVAGIFSGIFYKRQKDHYVLHFSAKYLKNWLIWSGIAGYLWIFFTYERAAILSSRFWILVWLFGFGAWLFFIVKKIKNLPKKEEEAKRKAQFDRYIPRKKK